MKGTVLATDGIIIETTCPLETECRGNYVGNMSRKGFFGMVAIAAVDCNCIFKLADMKWTGGSILCNRRTINYSLFKKKFEIIKI